jgi:hydrophobic/amphiphilic exporter-1 (mainly G- bacteria), HAE1 family
MTGEKHHFEEVLPRFSLNRRIGVLVLLASMVVVGVVAALGIPLELIPSGFSPPFLAVNVPWRDAPAQEVLDKVILPLEDELSTVRGLESLVSFSTTGFGRCFMNFKSGTDMDVAYREVRDRIERARALLPEDADRIYIRKEDESAIPVFVVGLAIDPELTDPYTLIQKQIVVRLQRLDGVASVDVNGAFEKEIFIELDRERTEAAGLNIYALATELGTDNFTMASGDVRYSGRKLLLRSVARYGDLEELQNRFVAPRVRLKDIGTVAYKEPEARFRVRANSRPAVALMVLKEGDANTLEVARSIRGELRDMGGTPSLQGIGMVPLFDQGRVITESLDTLLDSGKIGGIFAVLVLYFFLRRLRMTLIITLAIPLSMLIALTAMYFSGESLNILSLLALMISVGLLVDNSVVVAENIHRLHRSGVPRREAAIRGTAEIALAIVMATLTTIVVFLPVSLIGGQAQFFLLRLSIPISVALLASLVVAGIFVPLSVYLTLTNGDPRREWFFRPAYRRFVAMMERIYRATFGRINDLYGRLLAVFLRRRLDLIIGLFVVFAITAAVPMKQVKFVEIQEEERGGFELEVRLPRSTTIEEAETFFLECESIVEDSADELGFSGWFIFHRETFGQIQGFFNNPRTTDLTPREVTEIILERMPERPGVNYYTGSESESEAKGEQVHVIALYGDDSEVLETTAENLEALFTSIPGVLGAKATGDPAPSEIGLVIDRERAQQQNISPRVVAGMVGYALRGQQLNRYRTDGNDIPVRIRFAEEDRETLTQLKSFYLPTGSGGFVPLSSVTDTSYLKTARRIYRRDKQTSHTITLELEQGNEEETRKRVVALEQAIELPEGVRLGRPPRADSLAEDMKSLGLAAALSVVFIYLLMGFLFESFSLPLSIIFTIPLAGLGVYWTHFIFGYNLDFLGGVGLVLLIGVVVNNGIVLVDYINRLRSSGIERDEALLTAANRRFRPIMMTALTTICGMIPVTLSGTNSIGLSYTSFGLTLIGGLTTATLLTLLVVPVFYTLFDDLGVAIPAFLNALRKRNTTPSDTEPLSEL